MKDTAPGWLSNKTCMSQGVELGKVMSQSQESDADEADAEAEEQDTAEFAASEGKYYGGKWGIYVRAPDLWFRLLDNYGNKLCATWSNRRCASWHNKW